MGDELVAAAAGSVIASLLACVPGLHVYGVMGLLALLAHGAAGDALPPATLLVSAAMGMVAGYAVTNTVPAILFAAPDDSAMFTVLPGQRYLMDGRGREAVLLTGAGGLAGILLVALCTLPWAQNILERVFRVLGPHMHWMVWCVIAWMLLSEWPQAGPAAGTRRERWLHGWTPVAAGLLTFFLSGLLGFMLTFRSPVNVHAAFQNLMPAFVGLFTLPWLVLNLAARVDIPQQARRGKVTACAVTWLRGVGAGVAGGSVAAFLPAVTGGVGGLLAGLAAAQKDDEELLIAQGASKAVYYTGGFLLLFVPGLHLTRGGAAWIVTGLTDIRGPDLYPTAARALLTGGLVAFLALGLLTWGALFLLQRMGCRRVSCLALLAVGGTVAALTGWAGLLVAAVALGIGLIPPLHGCRPTNGLGIVLLPVACGMSGLSGRVAEWLGLV